MTLLPFRQLLKDEGGTALVIFSLTLFLLIGGAALAVDTARLTTSRARLTLATEQATAGAARNLQFMEAASLQSLAESLFTRIYGTGTLFTYAGSNPAAPTITVTPDAESGEVTVTATAAVPTTLMRAFNFFDDITISTSLTAHQVMPNMELIIATEATEALEMDGRLAAIKAAVLRLIGHLKAVKRVDAGLRFAALPFGNSLVNVAPHRDWVTTGSWPTEVPPLVPGLTAWTGDLDDQRWCVDVRSGAAGSDDSPPGDAPFPLILETSSILDIPSGLPLFSVTTTADCRSERLLPLDPDPAAFEAEFGSLTGNGTAAAGRALLWAERLLSPRWQGLWSADATSPVAWGNDTTRKAVLLIAGSDNAGGAAEDDLFTATCARLKTNGVTVFAINYLAPAGTSARMEACASSKGHYFRIESATDLSEALTLIGKSLVRVRFAG
ncbi:MAG: hypothetical protein EP348_04675 [Alphaproteobacteria bacterium]|nr:MAG: hypothetical protein EP348_04675 [Alphaproteobacteria bacterium]